jgi:hypothetical protein
MGKIKINDIVKMSDAELMSVLISGAQIEFNDVQALAYESLDSKTCIGAVSGILAGTLTIVKCPTGNAPGSTVTVGATAKNTGNVGNLAFVILITAARADNGAVIASGYSANMKLDAGATSPEFDITFTQPGVKVNIAFGLQADPDYNY